MSAFLQRVVLYPIAIIIIVSIDFIYHSYAIPPNTVHPIPSHSNKIIAKIKEYQNYYPDINFVYDKKSYINRLDKIGQYNLSYSMGIASHLAEHSLFNMLSPDNRDLKVFTFTGDECFIGVNPLFMGSLGDKPDDGVFNIDFVILHEIGHCKLSPEYSSIISPQNRKESELWADIFAIKEIILRGLDVNINSIIDMRGYSDMNNDEHLNKGELSNIDFYFISKNGKRLLSDSN